MARYRVTLQTNAFAYVVVDADSPEAAEEAAMDAELPMLCAQCSGWGQRYDLELSDEWEPETVELDDEPPDDEPT